MKEAERRGVELVLPVHLAAATHFAPDAEHSGCPEVQLPADREGVDAGPASALFVEKLADAKTVFWNWAGRGVRVPGVRRRHPRGRRGGGRRERADRGGRRRLGRRGSRARHPGEVRPGRIYWRWREPGIPRGKTLPGLTALEDERLRPAPVVQDDPAAPGPGPAADGRNWKMYMNHLEAIALVQKLGASTLTDKEIDAVQAAVMPPFTALRSAQTLIEGDKLRISYGAQDLSRYDSGAYTGEVSGPMLAKLGCDYVLAWTLGAAAVPRGDRRVGQREGAGRVRPVGVHADLVRGQLLQVRRADSISNTAAGSSTEPEGIRPPRWPGWRSPTSRSGHRHRKWPPRRTHRRPSAPSGCEFPESHAETARSVRILVRRFCQRQRFGADHGAAGRRRRPRRRSQSRWNSSLRSAGIGELAV